MKNHLIICSLILMLGSCRSSVKEVQIELKNTINVERKNEIVVIPRACILEKLGTFSNDMTLMALEGAKIIQSQLDDLDGDGSWDELVLLIDFKPMQTVGLSIKTINKTAAPQFVKRTNIRFAKIIEVGKKYEERDTASRLHGFMLDSTKQYPQFEGPGWENDKVAFRNYFDERNGIDIFGKITTKMLLDSVGINDDYHHIGFWGMDILKVGNSLGAGSLGAFYKDSLYRINAIEGATLRNVAEGPVRSILDLDFAKITNDSLTFGLKHRISIVAGEYGYRSDVFISDPTDSFMLATGLVNMHCKDLHTLSADSMIIFYTLDKQSENNDTLGMALILKKSDFKNEYRTADEGNGVINSFAMNLFFTPLKPVSFRFVTGWILSDVRFANRNYFETFLKEEAAKFANPIVYSVK